MMPCVEKNQGQEEAAPKTKEERKSRGCNPKSLFFLLSAEGSVHIRGLSPIDMDMHDDLTEA